MEERTDRQQPQEFGIGYIETHEMLKVTRFSTQKLNEIVDRIRHDIDKEYGHVPYDLYWTVYARVVPRDEEVK